MSQIQERIAQVTQRFESFADWEDRYKALIQFGRELAPLAEQERQDKFKVKGCQSQVWLVPDLVNGQVFFKADSDALLVKGIIALLVHVYNGASPSEVLSERGEFLKQMGITEHLSMNRSNGLASMLKQIQLYAMVYQSLGEKK